MRVLVTGSAGFIGRNLMALLGERGVPYDLAQGQDVRADMAEALSTVGAVVHLAAAGGVEQSVRYPAKSLDNARGVLSVLEGCRRTGAALVLASTAGALAGPPRSPYAASKAAGEAYCHAYRASYGVRSTVLRFGNVYGPWAAHKPSAIPALCRAALAGTPFELFGSGDQQRDFVFVGDVCRGILAALEGAGPGPFNLGSGRLERLTSIIGMVEGVSERSIAVVRREARQGEQEPAAPIDIAAAAVELGYRPTTALVDGLRQTWDWFAAAG